MSDIFATPSPDGDREPDLVYVVRLTCVAMFITLGIVWRSYVPGHRLYAPAPVFERLTDIPPWAAWGLFLLLLSSLVWLLVSPLNRLAAAVSLGLGIFLTLQDVNRQQPYFYMYYFTLFISAVAARAGAAGADSLRIMVSGVYFWAGFHKINKTFFLKTLPWFISPLHVFTTPPASPSVSDTLFTLLIFITPFFESLIGILLLIPKGRQIATIMAFAMLMTVLYCLGPFGRNWEKDVWPWNIWLFLMELRLFINFAGTRPAPFLLKGAKGLPALSIMLFCLAPVLAMFIPWYAYLGFKLYSGNVMTARVVLAQQETLAKAPPFLKDIAGANHAFEYNTVAEHYGITYFPDPYAIKTSTSGLCPYLDKPAAAILQLYSAPPFYTFRDEHKDVPLCR
jgi:uncharacterized membrane protein YphA (DoxX/SURF4 family)